MRKKWLRALAAGAFSGLAMLTVVTTTGSIRTTENHLIFLQDPVILSMYRSCVAG